ncbi:MAG: hypothetical protein ABSC93_22270 [Bryobacteraceae bacterium]|jgi:hypothetical protein
MLALIACVALPLGAATPAADASASTSVGPANPTATPVAGPGRDDSPDTKGKGTCLASLTLSPTQVAGGASTTNNTVTLTLVYRGGGIPISLSSGSAVARVPASVTVPPGDLAAHFTITTAKVSTKTSVTITGSYAGECVHTATLTVLP